MPLAPDLPMLQALIGAEMPDGDALRMLDAAPVGLFVVQDDRVVYANSAFCTLIGWPSQDLLGQAYEVITSPEQREHSRSVVRRRLAGRVSQPGLFRCLRRDGHSFDTRAHTALVNFRGRPAVLTTVSDPTDLNDAVTQSRWSEGMLERTEQLCRTGSFEIELPEGRLQLSRGLRSLVGLPEDTAKTALLDDWLIVPEEERAFVAGIWRNAVPEESFEFHHRVECRDGTRLTVLHRGVLHARAGNAAGLRGVALLQDITAQCEAERQLLEVTNNNEITGLPNRGHFLDQVDAAMHAARWSGGAFTLLAIDVARIAEIKASMGFGAGDTLAMAVAAHLKQASLDGELVAHLADTEFALLVEHEPDLAADTLRQRALSVKAELGGAVRLAVTDIFPDCVIGLATYPLHGETASELLEHAQTARQDAAALGGVAFFAHESSARAMRAMQIESGLRQALDNDDLQLAYQPQVDLGTGTIFGVEALVRWTSKQLGPVSPAEFIPIAEQSGLIGRLGDWVLREACRQAAAWRREGLPALRVNVNLSPAQLQRPDLARHIQAILVEAGIDPSCLGVELTESMAMADATRAAAVLSEIRAVGIKISLDDFGTGHSSLSCLRSLPIDVVKVDRSFAHDVTAAPEDVSVTRAIINMAHGLHMSVLVEGVETESQLALLAASGCDSFQGFWFSRPVDAAALAQMLRERRSIPARYVSGSAVVRTLLLVDDEENILSALKRLFRPDGYRIVTATGATEALQRLAEHPVDVIVSDQRMPGMTGVELLRRTKELYPETVRMVLSGYTDLQSIIDAVNEGAIYRFLTKPWDDERLRAHVAEAFKHKALGDENRHLARQVGSANAELAVLNERLEHAAAQQRERSRLIATSAGGMRDMLDRLPAAVLGLDDEGSIGYINVAASELLAGYGGVLGGSLSQVLPAGLNAMLADDADAQRDIVVDGQRLQAVKRRIGAGAGEHFTVLVLMPKSADACLGECPS
ncbi:MAG: hypothetical protein C0505_00200 [Leptothrix sp. (in: Bacteria)]|nr:hypothetical protein [Leptothrix sp. (in: b-proteobacteria)]